MTLRENYILAVIFFLPLLMFHWMLPFITVLSPGNTFLPFLMLWQTEYIFALKTGTFPLNMVWHDVQSGLMLGAGGIYHPITYIIALLPGYSSGMAMDWNILVRLLTISAAHVILYKFMREIKATVAIAFLLSTTTVYSLRILFSFYYGVGVEAWTGHLLLCVAIGFYCLKPSKIKGPLSIIGATYWLVCSGHPEEMYYGVLGAGIFTLVIPFFINAILPERDCRWKTVIPFWTSIFIFFSIGIILSAAYLLPIFFDARDLMLSRQNYFDACFNTDTLSGFIGNFFSPIRSFFVAAFGSTQLLLVAVLTPFLLCFRVKTPKVVWGILGIIILISLYMLGNMTPVHYYLWKYFPLVSSIRIPGRIALIQPILFMLILYWLFQKELIAFNMKIKAICVPAVPAAVFFLAYIFVLPLQFKNKLSIISKINLFIIPSWVEPVCFLLGIIILVSAAVYGLKVSARIASISIVVLCLSACIQLVLCFRYAPLARQTITKKYIRTFSEYIAQRANTMDIIEGYLFPFDNNGYPAYLARQKKRYFVEPYLGSIYRYYVVADSLEQAYSLLNSKRKQNEAVVENFREKLNVGNISADCINNTDRVSLSYSSYNRMVFKASACQPSFFVFSYNRTGNWQAWVNGNKTQSYRANGHAHAVHIPAGTSTVEFRCWNWAAFWGMLISCVTLAVIGIICCLSCKGNPIRYLASIVIIIAVSGLFFFWYNSLYSGDNLQTKYNWSSPPPDAPKNLAFGKPTKMSVSPFEGLNFDLIHSSRQGVDGCRDFSSCFSTDCQCDPWWEVDLLHPQPIGLISIYTSLQREERNKILLTSKDNLALSTKYHFSVFEEKPVNFNQIPLTVSISTDHEKWESTQIFQINKHRPLVIKPEQPVSARYVRISASGEGRLCLNEVEIYTSSSETVLTNESTYE